MTVAVRATADDMITQQKLNLFMLCIKWNIISAVHRGLQVGVKYAITMCRHGKTQRQILQGGVQPLKLALKFSPKGGGPDPLDGYYNMYLKLRPSLSRPTTVLSYLPTVFNISTPHLPQWHSGSLCTYRRYGLKLRPSLPQPTCKALSCYFAFYRAIFVLCHCDRHAHNLLSKLISVIRCSRSTL